MPCFTLPRHNFTEARFFQSTLKLFKTFVVPLTTMDSDAFTKTVFYRYSPVSHYGHGELLKLLNLDGLCVLGAPDVTSFFFLTVFIPSLTVLAL